MDGIEEKEKEKDDSDEFSEEFSSGIGFGNII